MSPLPGDSGSPIYSIAVPTHLLADREVSATAKLLYGVIDSFQRKSGVCYASNDRLAEEIAGCSPRTISRAVAELSKAGYIEVDDEKGRKIRLSVSACDGRTGRQKCLPPTTKLSTPHDKIGEGDGQNCLPSNTESNTTKKTVDPLPMFVDWIQSNLGSNPAESKNYLYSLLVDYKKMRSEQGNPLNTKRKVNGLLANLLDGSGGDIRVMMDMVTTATRRCWLTVYPPDRSAASPTPVREEREYQCV
jgi:SOS-response transcriptional repressor LexA